MQQDGTACLLRWGLGLPRSVSRPGAPTRDRAGAGEAEPPFCRFSGRALSCRCPAFLGQSRPDVPPPAQGSEGVERQAVEYQPLWGDCGGRGATVQPEDRGSFWRVVASLSCWLPDGGRGGVMQEPAAVGATFQLVRWLPDRTGDSGSFVPWVCRVAWRVRSGILIYRAERTLQSSQGSLSAASRKPLSVSADWRGFSSLQTTL